MAPIKSSKLFYSPPSSPQVQLCRKRVRSMSDLKRIQLGSNVQQDRRRAWIFATTAAVAVVLSIILRDSQPSLPVLLLLPPHPSTPPSALALSESANPEPVIEPWDYYDALISGALRVSWML